MRSTVAYLAASALCALLVACQAQSPRASAQAQAATSGDAVPKHVLTSGYLGGNWGSHTVNWTDAARYLTWAITNGRDANGISAAGIKTMFYSNPNRVLTTGVNQNMLTNDETTFAHTCDGQRAYYPYISGKEKDEYIMDVNSPGMWAVWKKVIARTTSLGHFDAVYEDDAGRPPVQSLIPSPPCNYSDDAWIEGEKKLEAAAGLPVVFNGLSQYHQHGVSQNIRLFDNPSTLGGDLEHCYATYAKQHKIAGWQWQAQENTELAVARLHRLFFCSVRQLDRGEEAIDERTYAAASFLLTYDLGTSVLSEDFETASKFHVEPESQLVPRKPVVPTPKTVDSLKLSSGVYGREYEQCYLAGNPVGACAVVVNPSDATHAFPYSDYHHTLALTGAGTLDGGTASTDGPAPPSDLGPREAAIAFR